MAAALFRRRLESERPDWQTWRIDSAGTWAPDGEMAAKNAQAVMLKRGIDLNAHRAKTVTREMLEESCLILTMEFGQKEALQVEFPQVATRVYLLSEMEEKLRPVEDPVGKPLPSYEETAEKIDQMLARGMPRILALVETQLSEETSSDPTN